MYNFINTTVQNGEYIGMINILGDGYQFRDHANLMLLLHSMGADTAMIHALDNSTNWAFIARKGYPSQVQQDTTVFYFF